MNRLKRKRRKENKEEKRTDKDITRSEDKTEERTKVIHYYLNSRVNTERKKRERRNGTTVVCTIKKVCAGVNRPQETLVKNRKNHDLNHRSY